MPARLITLLSFLCFLAGCNADAPSVSSSPDVLTLPGFEKTAEVGKKQREERQRTSHAVSRRLPELRIADLRRSMLGEQNTVLTPSSVKQFEGHRVRVRGYALPLVETRRAVRFALQEIPYVGGTIEVFPPPNGQLLVVLRGDRTFDFTDAPLWVEGNFHVGVFPSFADDEKALFALEDAQVEVLPAETMTIPLFVDMPEGFRQRSDLELFPGGLAPATTEAP